MKVTRSGLIDLLVGVAAPASLGMWWSSVLAWIGFIVAPRSSIEVGASSLRSGGIGAMMLASSIAVGAAATSQHGGVRWHTILKLVDLDMCSYDVRTDLLDLWSVREFVKLVESDG